LICAAEEIKEFLNVVIYGYVISIDAFTNGHIEIGINVNNVFIEIDNC
jgi:hypothetical protein